MLIFIFFLSLFFHISFSESFNLSTHLMSSIFARWLSSIGKREWQRSGNAASSDIDPHSSNTTLPPSCAVLPSDDVFRMSGSPPPDPAECRGIRNWGLACHKYWWRGAALLLRVPFETRHSVLHRVPTSQARPGVVTRRGMKLLIYKPYTNQRPSCK